MGSVRLLRNGLLVLTSILLACGRDSATGAAAEDLREQRGVALAPAGSFSSSAAPPSATVPMGSVRPGGTGPGTNKAPGKPCPCKREDPLCSCLP